MIRFFVTFITWTAYLDKLFNRYPWFFLWKQAKQLQCLLVHTALTHNSIYPLLLFYYFHSQFTFHRTQVHKIIRLKEWKMVNFKLGETNVKRKWSACHKRETNRIPTYDLPHTGRVLYPLWAMENSWRARPCTRFIFDMRPAYCKPSIIMALLSMSSS